LQPEVIQDETHASKKDEVHDRPLVTKSPVKKRKVSVEKTKDPTKKTLVPPEPVDPLPEKSADAIHRTAVEEEPKGRDGGAETPSPFETASLQKEESHDRLQEEEGAPGGGWAEGIMGKAIPIYQEKPHYPSVARRRGYEGKVVLEVEVLGTGKVGQIKIVKSSGFKVLDRAAIKSVKNWMFPPGRKKLVIQPITFDLKDT
jgi:protein TonB